MKPYFHIQYFAPLLLILALPQSWAEDALPSAISGVKILSAAQVAGLPSNVKVIDTRPLHDYLAAHIPGSLHIAYKEQSEHRINYDAAPDNVPAFLLRLHKLVPDQRAPLVLYCNGGTCWKSYKAILAIKTDGYTNIAWLRGGMAEWISEKLPVDSR